MEDRDANEFAIVLAGYYRLIVGKWILIYRSLSLSSRHSKLLQTLNALQSLVSRWKVGKELETHIEHDKEINQEDVAPPFLSQHNVFPAGWNYLQLDDKPTHSMAFLMPPPYHSTKQLLLTSSKQNPNINNNDEQMANRNYLPSLKYSHQLSSESDEFGFDMHSVVSMEILENQDQYKQTLKHFPQQKLTTFVEAKNNEVLRRVAEMQKMVESSQQYLNENDENGFPKRQWESF
jgi:FERM and PDZ domain-containing protein 4